MKLLKHYFVKILISMRHHLRFLLVGLLWQAIIFIIFWRIYRFTGPNEINTAKDNEFNSKSGQSICNDTMQSMKCSINGEYEVECKNSHSGVYVPFDFIQHYFEISGKFVEDQGIKRFEWIHSSANVYLPTEKYDPRGAFTHFQNYKVEERDRVKCVTASDGVPISTQWNQIGYYYPTQIAQFGLSHFSKNLSELRPKIVILEDAELKNAKWIYSLSSKLRRLRDPFSDSKVLEFIVPGNNEVVLNLNDPEHFVVNVDLKLRFKNDGAFIVKVQNKNKQTWRLRYDCSKEHIYILQPDVIVYGMDCERDLQWKKLIRDVLIDLQKGLMIQTRTRFKISRKNFKIIGISIMGSGALDNLTLSTSNHEGQFYAAAQWFVNNQNNVTGGWPNMVTRRMGGTQLTPGWYSAMGQGHGLSLLSRAYYHSGGDDQYLECALKALRPFQKLSKDGGVLTMFLNSVPWYEEYPTQPSSMVLNGFMYSLIGMYDLMSIMPSQMDSEVRMLYDQGMKSLKTLLMSYDTGSGTMYDLRHITMSIPPRLARWDYHAIHVNQLFILATIDDDPIILATAKRWHGYMTGKRASHN